MPGVHILSIEILSLITLPVLDVNPLISPKWEIHLISPSFILTHSRILMWHQITRNSLISKRQF